VSPQQARPQALDWAGQYLQPFTSYIARYWSEIATFSYTLAFYAPVDGLFPLEFRENVWTSEN